MNLKTFRLAPLGLLLLMAKVTVLEAQEADITFFVIGKHATFSQDSSGQRTPVDFSFFAEVFLSENGDASNGRLTLPDGSETAFEDYRQVDGGQRDNILGDPLPQAPGILLSQGGSRICTRADGIRVAHSGRPFENKPFLRYAAEAFTIPAGTMA